MGEHPDQCIFLLGFISKYILVEAEDILHNFD